MQRFKNTIALSLNKHQKQLYFLLGTLNFFALIMYVVIHVGVYGTEFNWQEDADVLLKLLLTASLMAVILHVIGIMLFLLEKLSLRKNFMYRKIKLATLLVVVLSLLMASCGQQPIVRGVMKDLNTGINTTYQNMEPEEVLLVMNGEKIGHTDIPLGEQFALVAKNVKGLVQKNGRVSVGASLTITDSAGRVLLSEPDLFKYEGSISAQDARYLKCLVSTGKPMKWDEPYDIKVRFWDKWGTGHVENELTIFTNSELAQE